MTSKVPFLLKYSTSPMYNLRKTVSLIHHFSLRSTQVKIKQKFNTCTIKENQKKWMVKLRVLPHCACLPSTLSHTDVLAWPLITITGSAASPFPDKRSSLSQRETAELPQVSALKKNAEKPNRRKTTPPSSVTREWKKREGKVNKWWKVGRVKI